MQLEYLNKSQAITNSIYLNPISPKKYQKLFCPLKFLNDRNTALCNIPGYNLIANNGQSKSKGGSLTYPRRDDIELNIEGEFESILIRNQKA